MGKKRKKAKAKKIPPRRLRLWHLFLAGFFLGVSLHWIPLDPGFSEFTLKPASWKPASKTAFPMPTTAPIIEHEGYRLAYDGRTRNAHWAYFHLTQDAMKKSASREDCDFKEDHLIPSHIRATKADYHQSGFDRGHLIPAANLAFSQAAMQDSFLLSNVAPQHPVFNRGYWKQLENHMRDLLQAHEEVHLFTGPLYLSKEEKGKGPYVTYQVIGKNQVAVPTHFFACAFIEMPGKKFYHKAYIVPNKAIDSKVPLRKFACSLTELEKASGIIFAHPLSEGL